jgi:VanZ family protein
MTRTTYFLFYWAAALLYAALILGLSSIQKLPGTPTPDKINHFVEYFLFAFLLWRALTGGRIAGFSWSRVGIVILVCGTFGLLDEYYQSFIPGRVSSILDWYADIAGIFAMITFVLIYLNAARKVTQPR